MKTEEVETLLVGADAQLNRAIEGLINLDARHADYALALDEAAAQLLRLKSVGLVPAEHESVLSSLKSLSSKAAQASRLLDSAASLYFGQAACRSNAEFGYNADGGADRMPDGALLRMEA